MIRELEKCGITAERKSVYDDIEALTNFGIDVIKINSAKNLYYVGERSLELPELKLLVDAVQSSKFITKKKSSELISKIEAFASRYQAKNLERQVFVANRIKTMNESIYYNVDEIHSGISENKQIAFKYYEYSVSKARVPRKNGEDYIVSPIALTWDDQNYYMIAYDEEAARVKHYRVDKMENPSPETAMRDGRTLGEALDLSAYAKKIFGMYHGDETLVTLRVENALAGIILDRFGHEPAFVSVDPLHFEVRVRVSVSPQFLGWIMSFGRAIRIVGPDNVVEDYRKLAKEILEDG